MSLDLNLKGDQIINTAKVMDKCHELYNEINDYLDDDEENKESKDG